MIAYTCGSFDILRAKDLEDLDLQIQISNRDGNDFFGVGIYEEDLCKNLGMNLPLKSLEDRMAIMSKIRGVDFVFPVSTLDEDVIKQRILSIDFDKIREERSKVRTEKKKYELGYCPGTYDLFHAGHLENLSLASEQCEKLIVGVKADELVQEHKGKIPTISDTERAEILRYFTFVNDTHIYYTRDPRVAVQMLEKKHNQPVDAIFAGSDLRDHFDKYPELNIIYTPRSPEKMKVRSTTAIAGKLRLLRPTPESDKKYTGNLREQINEPEQERNRKPGGQSNDQPPDDGQQSLS